MEDCRVATAADGHLMLSFITEDKEVQFIVTFELNLSSVITADVLCIHENNFLSLSV